MESKVSVVILTHNSEATIRACLDSLSWVDEICILDDNSRDETLGIAAKFQTRIFQRRLGDDFSKQRNYGLTLVKNQWVLFLDADEVVSTSLANDIQVVTKNDLYEGFRIRRNTYRNGRILRFGEFFRFSLVRLGKKDLGRWEGRVHEEWKIKGNIGKISSPILHFQNGGIKLELSKINIYSSMRAGELYAEKKSSSYPAIAGMPLGKFFINYVLKLGVLDGIPGLIIAISMSFYTFLVRAKLWLLWHESTKIVRN